MNNLILSAKALSNGLALKRLAVALASFGMFSSAMALSISTPFTEATLPGWTIAGNATLTAATGVDPVGSGWLRLTDNTGDQRSTALYDTAFPSSDGLLITFQYATWGKTSSEGADGIAMYLVDGSLASPTIGAAYGGSLGYSSYTGVWGLSPGVAKGYVGIGFDEFGNFSDADYGGGCTITCAFKKNSVAVRGAGNLIDDTSSVNTPLNEFSLLASESVSAIETGTTDRGNIATVQIVITPAPNPTITVRRDTGSGYVTIINALSLASNGSVPSTFKLGFSASTGGSNNYHEIRNLTIQDLTTAANPTGATTGLAPIPALDAYGLALLLASMAGAFAWVTRRSQKS